MNLVDDRPLGDHYQTSSAMSEEMMLPYVLRPQPSLEEVKRLLQRYPLPQDSHTGLPIRFNYGTAGFRYNASLLESVMVRVGILAAYRSGSLGISKQQPQEVGVMVTASHNDESYNGVKIADPHGGMMTPEGEALAVKLANASTSQELLNILSDHHTVTVSDTTIRVHVGRDTRRHSPALTQLVIRAAQAMGATVIQHGIVTTPMLHYCVMQANAQYLPPLIPPRPNVVGYMDTMAYSYMALLATAADTQAGDPVDEPLEPLVVDCACGVGYPNLKKLIQRLHSLGCKRPIEARNGPDDGPLNDGCGSEHVQKQVLPPHWYEDVISPASSPNYGASLDGDADRIVFFSQRGRGNHTFCLLDGDKIAVLICDFLQDQVEQLKQAMGGPDGSTRDDDIKLGVVQTAYANGASTAYLKQTLGEDNVKIAKTGVKHVHSAAHHYFDIGVYFEANGHGTVLFSDAFHRFLAKADGCGARGHVALRRLQLLPALVNQAVGDSLSDLLLVDAILQLKKWNIQTWGNLYQDLPSRQCKVKVRDRTMIKTNENETKSTAPDGLQDALDQAMKEVEGCNAATGSARAFVRPSGTENVVRVYAEAATMEAADTLATKAAQLVHDLCDGIAEPPKFPISKM